MSAASSPPPRLDDPLIGVVFGDRYRIESCLGAGGVGVVYEATHLGLGRVVALKVLKDALDVREDTRLRFEREAQVLSRLSHPNIVPLTDYGVHDSMPYLVMERLRGLTAAQLLRDVGAPSAELALRIIEGTLRALAYAHGRGVLHRDLKPANVFLQALPDDPYHVRLLDFGLAKVLDGRLSDLGEEAVSGAPLTRNGYVLGTPAYMAPEQASGGQVDGRADVYAVGVLLFELLTGRTPFVEKRRSDMLRAHMVRQAPSLAQAAPGLCPAPELERLTAAALSKSPGERWQSAEDMLSAIQALPRPAARPCAPSPVAAPENVSGDAETAVALPRASRRRQARGGLRLAMLAFGAVASLWMLLGLARWAFSPSVPPPAAEQDAAADAGVVPEAAAPASLGLVAELSARVEQGEPLSSDQRRELRAWQRAHATAPEASLLLARDATLRRWHDAAIQRYGIALRLDPSLAQRPAVRAGLLQAVTSETVGERASGMVRDLYGVAALSEARELLAHTRGRAERRRLRSLIRALAALPDAGG